MHRIAPSVSRVALLFNPQSEPYARYYLETFHAGAAALSVTAIEAPFHDAVEIKSVMTNLGSNSDAGLVVMPGIGTSVHRELICALAARLRLPTIYPFRFFISSGGLLSYGIDARDLLRGAASYVDRRSLPTAPRTEPRERNSRTRLPPWVCDGKAHLRPRMKGCWLREIVGCDLRDPLPRRAILLAAAL